MAAGGIGRRAGIWRRLAAIGYDLLLVLALSIVVTGGVIAIRSGAGVDPGTLWLQLLLLGCWWAYFVWSWVKGGQTLGMRAWRMHLQPIGDRRIGIARASLRFVAACLSVAALGAGFVWSVLDRDGLGWHDRLSKTELRVLG